MLPQHESIPALPLLVARHASIAPRIAAQSNSEFAASVALPFFSLDSVLRYGLENQNQRNFSLIDKQHLRHTRLEETAHVFRCSR